MNFKSVAIVSLLTISSQFANAMIAPWYVQLRVFDAVVTAFSHEAPLEADETMDDVEVSSIQVLADGNIAISNESKSCIYKMKTNPLPVGALGVPGYSALKQSCEVLEQSLRTAPYEVVSERLDKAAKLSKMVKSITVSKKGTLKITYK